MNRARYWSDRLVKSDQAIWLIGVASFLEATIVPIPLEVVLIPFMLANRDRIWFIATITTIGCLLGAVLGYGVGVFLFQSVGQWLINAFGWEESLRAFRTNFDTYGFWAILAVGITPIPFQVAMLTAGAAGYPLLWFLLASGIARGLRYYGLAGLVLAFGDRALYIWKNHSTTVGVSAVILVVCGFVAARYVPTLFG